MKLRNGQWVKFDGDFPGAMHAKDGRTVGIFTFGQKADGPFAAKPDLIHVVDPDGNNLVMLLHGTAFNVEVSPDQPNLVPVTDHQDLPQKRIAGIPDVLLDMALKQ